MIPQSFRQMLRVAGKNPVAGQSAVVEQPIGQITDESAGIAALDPHSRLDGSFDRLVPRDFEQDDGVVMGLGKRFEVAIFRRQHDCEALLA